jgi:hypothetical protein
MTIDESATALLSESEIELLGRQYLQFCAERGDTTANPVPLILWAAQVRKENAMLNLMLAHRGFIVEPAEGGVRMHLPDENLDVNGLLRVASPRVLVNTDVDRKAPHLRAKSFRSYSLAISEGAQNLVRYIRGMKGQ